MNILTRPLSETESKNKFVLMDGLQFKEGKDFVFLSVNQNGNISIAHAESESIPTELSIDKLAEVSVADFVEIVKSMFNTVPSDVTKFK